MFVGWNKAIYLRSTSVYDKSIVSFTSSAQCLLLSAVELENHTPLAAAACVSRVAAVTDLLQTDLVAGDSCLKPVGIVVGAMPVRNVDLFGALVAKAAGDARPIAVVFRHVDSKLLRAKSAVLRAAFPDLLWVLGTPVPLCAT